MYLIRCIFFDTNLERSHKIGVERNKAKGNKDAATVSTLAVKQVSLRFFNASSFK